MNYDNRFTKQIQDEVLWRQKKMSKLNFLNQKKWYESKTVWIQIVSMLLGISLILIQEYQTGGVLTAAGVINTILRFLTSEEITA